MIGAVAGGHERARRGASPGTGLRAYREADQQSAHALHAHATARRRRRNAGRDSSTMHSGVTTVANLPFIVHDPTRGSSAPRC